MSRGGWGGGGRLYISRAEEGIKAQHTKALGYGTHCIVQSSSECPSVLKARVTDCAPPCCFANTLHLSPPPLRACQVH